MTRGAVAISAERTIAHAPERVFALLTDLRRHWPLLGEDLVRADLDADASGAILEVHAPFLPIRRRVVTRIVRSEAPSLFEGEAVADATHALIEWQVVRMNVVGGDHSGVTLTGTIHPGGVRDRLLVTAVQPWLARRVREILRRLEQELDADDLFQAEGAA